MKKIDKELIIQEYFQEKISYGKLAQRHSLPKQTVWQWIKQYKNEHESIFRSSNEVQPENIEHGGLNDYRKALEKSKLEAKLWKSMIDIAEKELGIDIRKKFGAKQ
jgi:transposase